MEAEFWHRRWKKNEIGFHQAEINARLRQFWDALGIRSGETVFVPLCGKSQDMLWLAHQGHPVLGVELSLLAISSFFQGNGLRPRSREEKGFQVWEAAGITLWGGDFFALDGADIKSMAGVYDRASLIALPPAMRERYVCHLMAILPSTARLFLVTLEYPQELMKGPPFSVSEAEVRALYGEAYVVELLVTHDALPESPRFREHGLPWLWEKVYRLIPKQPPAGAAGE
jgi:thiopurine S-methyltransferase